MLKIAKHGKMAERTVKNANFETFKQPKIGFT